MKVYCKGAPELVLEHAKYFLDKEGNIVDLDAPLKDIPDALRNEGDSTTPVT